MNNLQKRKLRTRLMVVVISILSCIAVMAVGVYAATLSFTVTVKNQVDITVTTTNGELYGRRYGDVLYGTISRGDSGLDDSGVTYETQNADTKNVSGADENGFVHLFGSTAYNGFDYYEEGMNEIKKPVNFYYTKGKDKLTINYVFKFVFYEGSPTNVNISLTDNSTTLTDSRKDKIALTYKYSFGATEPADWSKVAGVFNQATPAGRTIKVREDTPSTHTVYMLASMTIARTNTLKGSFTLGLGTDEYHWRFTLQLTPEQAQ